MKYLWNQYNELLPLCFCANKFRRQFSTETLDFFHALANRFKISNERILLERKPGMQLWGVKEIEWNQVAAHLQGFIFRWRGLACQAKVLFVGSVWNPVHMSNSELMLMIRQVIDLSNWHCLHLHLSSRTPVLIRGAMKLSIGWLPFGLMLP
jgi:hypothetical protein